MRSRLTGRAERQELFSMSDRFANKIALITGGSAGIGRAIARAFAREGAKVVVAGRSPDPLKKTVELIRNEGGIASAITADVSHSDDVSRLVAETITTYGALDIAVNNAGTLLAAGPVGDTDPAQWHRIVSVNLTGVLLSMQHEIAQMRRNGGTIINIASTIGTHKRVPGLGAYAATKAAVIALTRTAALDHIREGIRINAISPGPIDTPGSYRPGETSADRDARVAHQIPLQRVGRLDEIAAAALYLASPDAGFLVATDLVLDGGSTA
jgi:NAD(P)-dependent dehydrogenase (short-subunit alcohol dehydrogenase family)